MLKRLMIAVRCLVGVALVAGAIVFMAYEEHHASVKYQRECQEHGAAIAAAGSSEEKKSSTEKCQDPKDYMPWWYLLVAWPEGITTWAVIATGFVIAWQSYETRKAATATRAAVTTGEKSFRMQEDTAKRQLRAYVGVKGARLFLHDDGSVEPKVEIFNSGQTPAYDIHGADLAKFSEYPVPKPGRPPDDARTSTGIIGAGLPYYLLSRVLPSGSPSREELLRELSNRKVVFCLNGYYAYRDIFKDVHYIEFQMIVGGPAGIPKLSKDDSGIFAVFSNDSEGNDAD